MGATVGEVYKTLRRRAVQGRQHSCKYCPVAQYLRRRGWLNAEVSGAFAQAAINGWTYAVDLPLPVQEFVQDFDSGWYPELVQA